MNGIPLFVWSRKGISSVNESCVINKNGDYVGLKTGNVYDKMMYYHSEVFMALVVCVDKKQLNGMIHLDPEDKDGIKAINRKHSFIGCVLPFRKAHLYGEHQVYQCILTHEYFNDLEIKLI